MRFRFPKIKLLRLARNRLLRHGLWVIPMLALLMSCSNLGYYWQSAGGHLKIMSQREDIEDILSKADTDDNLKQKLELVKKIRVFASQKLYLPENDSYSQFVDLHRKFVVWNVFAAPEFSTTLKQWCFLFVGCVGYRGYYNEQDALDFADQIKSEEKLDVHVGGTIAYSTLGWFDDPVLSTFIGYSEPNLAGLIFHELTHQFLYIKNDAAFNEGLANTVEMEGVKRWMQQHQDSVELARYEKLKNMRQVFVSLLTQTNQKLRELYLTPEDSERMRDAKTKIIDDLRSQFDEKKRVLPELKIYDAWFRQPINNATLGSVAIYEDYVPGFQQLLLDSNNDLAEFFQRVKTLSESPRDARDAALKQLARRHGGGHDGANSM